MKLPKQSAGMLQPCEQQPAFFLLPLPLSQVTLAHCLVIAMCVFGFQGPLKGSDVGSPFQARCRSLYQHSLLLELIL